MQQRSLLAMLSLLFLAGCGGNPTSPAASAYRPEPDVVAVEPASPTQSASEDPVALDQNDSDEPGPATRRISDDPKPASDPSPELGEGAVAAKEEGADTLSSLWTRTAGVDWPTFLGPTGDSKSPETGIVTKWPKAGPKIVWQRELGQAGPGEKRVDPRFSGIGYGIGSVSQGRFYQFDRSGNKARCFCLNAETGEELWKFEYPSVYEDKYGYDGGPRCSPVIDGNRVYVFGVEGMLHCLNATTGKLIWKLDTNRSFGVVQNYFGVGSTPVVEGDLLIAMIGGSPPEADGDLPPNQFVLLEGNGTGIVAFDKFTGKIKYKITDELASYSSLKLATIEGRRWCFAFTRANLVGFDPAKGEVDFQYAWRAKNPESVNASVPVVVGNQVFISETYGPGSSLLEVAPGTRKVVWADDPLTREKAMQTHWNTPIYVDGYLYGSSGRHLENAELRCIEWKTGKVMWSEPGLTRTSLLYVDGHFVCLGETGTIHLLKVNPKKFDVVAEVTLRGDAAAPSPLGFGPPQLLKEPCWAAPILSHGLLYVRGKDRLVCLELIPSKK